MDNRHTDGGQVACPTGDRGHTRCPIEDRGQVGCPVENGGHARCPVENAGQEDAQAGDVSDLCDTSDDSDEHLGSLFTYSDTYIEDRELEYEYEPGISLSALHFSRDGSGQVREGHCKGCRCMDTAPSGHCGGCACLQETDLQLAAELGKTLLERNRELENSIKHHQAVIEDQGQEIEYLTKQTAALREVNESRVRVYEQLEISLQEAETLNSRLMEESASDKARIKSLTGIVENLEQKCEDLQAIVQETKNQAESQAGKRKKERRRSSPKGGYRKPSSLQLDGAEESSGELSATSDKLSDLSDDAALDSDSSDYASMHNNNNNTTYSTHEEQAGRDGEQRSPIGGDLSSRLLPTNRSRRISSSNSQEESSLELELVELNSELERLRELRTEESARILELELQVRGLVGENYALSAEAAAARGEHPVQLEPDLHINRFESLPTCLCAEVLKANCGKQMRKTKGRLSVVQPPETTSHATSQSVPAPEESEKQQESALSKPDQAEPVTSAAAAATASEQEENNAPTSFNEGEEEDDSVDTVEHAADESKTIIDTDTVAEDLAHQSSNKESSTNLTKQDATAAEEDADEDEEAVVSSTSSSPHEDQAGVAVVRSAVTEQLEMIIESAVDKVKTWDLKVDDVIQTKPNFKLGTSLNDDLETVDDVEDKIQEDKDKEKLQVTSLQEELKMSGQYEMESDTLSSGFSEGSEHRYCSRETQTEQELQEPEQEQEQRAESSPDEGSSSPPNSPQYRQIFREIFRVLDEAKKNPRLDLDPRNPRTRLQKLEKAPKKTRENPKVQNNMEDFPSLHGDTEPSAVATEHSYAEILRRGIKM